MRYIFCRRNVREGKKRLMVDKNNIWANTRKVKFIYLPNMTSLLFLLHESIDQDFLFRSPDAN